MSQLFTAPMQSLEKDERYTPRWVFDGLGITFDVDPASPGHGQGDCVPAITKYTLKDDGLASEWVGRVWLNPPFSNCSAWADKFIAHRHGIFLGPFANARWTQRMMAAADLMWMCQDISFTHPTHSGKHSSMPLFFAAIGQDCADALGRLASLNVHPGTLLERKATT